MTNRRVVLGATGTGDTLAGLARMLRDTGHEVILVGGAQSAEQLVLTAVAEDAGELVVVGGPDDLARVADVRRAVGAEDVTLTDGNELIGA
jgi:methylmalonyl-CoA mutase cobalamin-binding subunit